MKLLDEYMTDFVCITDTSNSINKNILFCNYSALPMFFLHTPVQEALKYKGIF